MEIYCILATNLQLKLQLTVAMATASILVFLLFLYSLLDACLLARRIKKAERKLQKFKKEQIRRDSTQNLNAELWYPDLSVYRCINDPDFTVEKGEQWSYIGPNPWF